MLLLSSGITLLISTWFKVPRPLQVGHAPYGELNEKEEWIPILKKLDRINRIIWIIRPLAERPLAAGEKIPENPVNPV